MPHTENNDHGNIALGKIISSESHLLYHVRVYDTSERESPPQIPDYPLGRFVFLDTQSTHSSPPSQGTVVGIIANSRLLHLDNYAPRASMSRPQNSMFPSDSPHDVGVLLTILLLGSLQQGFGNHNIPTHVIPVGTEVITLPNEQIRDFHHNRQQQFQMRYYPLLRESGISFFSSLLLQICQQIEPLCTLQEHRMLNVIRKNVIWNTTLRVEDR